MRDVTDVTDEVIDAIANRLGGLLDLSVFGARRLTDRGLASLSGLGCPNLRWYCSTGAYKTTPAGMQCLLSAHPSLLIYNKPEAFGTPEHGVPSAAAEQL